MKNDTFHLYTILNAVIIAGIIIALASPAPAASKAPDATAPSAVMVAPPAPAVAGV